jgi:hypothetical protein
MEKEKDRIGRRDSFTIQVGIAVRADQHQVNVKYLKRPEHSGPERRSQYLYFLLVATIIIHSRTLPHRHMTIEKAADRTEGFVSPSGHGSSIQRKAKRMAL